MKLKSKLKMFLIPSAYATLASVFIFGIIFFGNSVNQPDVTNNIPVVNPDPGGAEPVDKEVRTSTILKPFTDPNVKVIKSFYDYQADEEAQVRSIIYFEKTYLQNRGIDFSSDKPFEVIAIMDGVVTEVKEDNVMGKIITIKHNDNLTSQYKSLSEVNVKEDDKVRAGDLIGKSGTNKMNSESENHLYFALIFKNRFVNPENYWGKNINEL